MFLSVLEFYFIYFFGFPLVCLSDVEGQFYYGVDMEMQVAYPCT